jgi:hypothetical protein
MEDTQQQQQQQSAQDTLSDSEWAALAALLFWSEVLQRYVTEDGAVVAPRAARAVLDETLAGGAEEARRLLRQMRQGDISIGEWQRRMQRLTKNAHVTSAAVAKGGFGQLSTQSQREVEDALSRQFERLARFARQIEDGLPLDGLALQRAGGYVQAARTTYEQVRLRGMEEAGFVEERNVLDPGAESCEQCLTLTAAGWRPIGSMPPPGERTCLYNCRCRLERRGSAQGGPFSELKVSPQGQLLR